MGGTAEGGTVDSHGIEVNLSSRESSNRNLKEVTFMTAQEGLPSMVVEAVFSVILA